MECAGPLPPADPRPSSRSPPSVQLVCTLLRGAMPRYDKARLRHRLVALRGPPDRKRNHCLDVLAENLLEEAKQRVPWFGVTGVPGADHGPRPLPPR